MPLLSADSERVKESINSSKRDGKLDLYCRRWAGRRSPKVEYLAKTLSDEISADGLSLPHCLLKLCPGHRFETVFFDCCAVGRLVKVVVTRSLAAYPGRVVGVRRFR